MSEEKKLPRRVKVRVFRESPEAFFRAGFERIANTRMKGIPICNPKLRVATVPFRKVDGQWVGAVVTPWSIRVPGPRRGPGLCAALPPLGDRGPGDGGGGRPDRA